MLTPMLQLTWRERPWITNAAVDNIHDPFGGNRRVGHVPYMSQHDKEFVATQTGNGVLLTSPFLEPFCNSLQEEVADRVPQ